jgi:hypothetical protein
MVMSNDPVTSALIERTTEACRDEPISEMTAVVASLLKATINEHFSGKPPAGVAELVILLERIQLLRDKDVKEVDAAARALGQRITATYRGEPSFRVLFVLGTLLLSVIRQNFLGRHVTVDITEESHTFFAELVSVLEREILLRQSENGRP